MTSPGARSRFWRRAALWYVLASSYLVAALLLNRALTGIWGVSREFLTLLIAVPSAQLVVLELVRSRLLAHDRSEGMIDRGSDP